MDQHLVNGGSPVGPGFVVYERTSGQLGYDLDLALASVGKGWHGLLRELFGFMDLNPHMLEAGGAIIQIKEKFGTLRVSLAGGSAYLDGIITGLELASGSICEVCGMPGRLRGKDEGRSWILTLCDGCQAKPGPLELGG